MKEKLDKLALDIFDVMGFSDHNYIDVSLNDDHQLEISLNSKQRIDKTILAVVGYNVMGKLEYIVSKSGDIFSQYYKLSRISYILGSHYKP